MNKIDSKLTSTAKIDTMSHSKITPGLIFCSDRPMFFRVHGVDRSSRVGSCHAAQ